MTRKPAKEIKNTSEFKRKENKTANCLPKVGKKAQVNQISILKPHFRRGTYELEQKGATLSKVNRKDRDVKAWGLTSRLGDKKKRLLPPS